MRLSRWWRGRWQGRRSPQIVIAVVVLAGSALALFDASRDGDAAARQQVVGIATALADSPSTATAIESGRATEILQPVTIVRKNTDIAFITIMAPNRTRFTHYRPGEQYIGTTNRRCAVTRSPGLHRHVGPSSERWRQCAMAPAASSGWSAGIPQQSPPTVGARSADDAAVSAARWPSHWSGCRRSGAGCARRTGCGPTMGDVRTPRRDPAFGVRG